VQVEEGAVGLVELAAVGGDELRSSVESTNGDRAAVVVVMVVVVVGVVVDGKK
jgi:hypothetical protein